MKRSSMPRGGPKGGELFARYEREAERLGDLNDHLAYVAMRHRDINPDALIGAVERRTKQRELMREVMKDLKAVV